MSSERARILAVDDERQIREVLKAAVEEMGHECTTASDAETASRLLAAQPYDLVLLDVMMPGRPGVALFREIMERYPDLAVVFLTAKADLDLAVDTMRSGAYDYILKPATLDRLEEVVNKALQKRRSLAQKAAYQRDLEANLEKQRQGMETYSRELQGLNRLMQSRVMERQEIAETAREMMRTARSSAELLMKMAQEIEARLDGALETDRRVPSK